MSESGLRAATAARMINLTFVLHNFTTVSFDAAAQHLLTGVAQNLFNSSTTNWRFVPGQHAAAYIDVEGVQFTAADLNRLERECNNAINLRLPIRQVHVRQPGQRNGLQADDAGSSNEAEDTAPQVSRVQCEIGQER